MIYFMVLRTGSKLLIQCVTFFNDSFESQLVKRLPRLINLLHASACLRVCNEEMHRGISPQRGETQSINQTDLVSPQTVAAAATLQQKLPTGFFADETENGNASSLPRRLKPKSGHCIPQDIPKYSHLHDEIERHQVLNNPPDDDDLAVSTRPMGLKIYGTSQTEHGTEYFTAQDGRVVG